MKKDTQTQWLILGLKIGILHTGLLPHQPQAVISGPTSCVPRDFVEVDELPSEPKGCVSPCRRLRWPHPQPRAPGGNLTGFMLYEVSLAGELVELLKEMVPHLARVALVFNPENISAAGYWRSIETVAKSLGVIPASLPVRDAADIRDSVDTFVREPEGGLVLALDVTTIVHRYSPGVAQGEMMPSKRGRVVCSWHQRDPRAIPADICSLRGSGLDLDLALGFSMTGADAHRRS